MNGTARFPYLQSIRLQGFNVNTFTFVRWIPYEETAFGYISKVLRKRSTAWYDGTRDRGDMHEAVKACLVILPGDTEYMAGVDSDVGNDDDDD